MYETLGAKFKLSMATVIAGETMLQGTTSLDAPIGYEDSDAGLYDRVAAQELAVDERYALAVIRHAVRTKCDDLAPTLDERARVILDKRLLTEPGDELTLEEVGATFSLSRERIRQLEVDLAQLLRAKLRPEWDEYQGLVRKRNAPPAPTQPAAPRQPPRQLTPPKPHVGISPRTAFYEAVAFQLSVMGWPKAVLRRNEPVIRQAFEWEMEPMQCAMRVNRIEAERGKTRR